MHTTGEPTRIIISGYPILYGTLLQQRAEAKKKYDHIRKRLLLEPRGHYDMYGAILRSETELTKTGEAHIGVLFMTNDGYSTMCGHATIALGRFLLDTHDLDVFPQRNQISHDPATKTAFLYLHAPCGLLKVTVPVIDDGSCSDPKRPVSFISVPSFATGLNISINVRRAPDWPAFAPQEYITADFSYGGAFFCIVKATELGFSHGLRNIDFATMNLMTRSLKAVITSDDSLRKLFSHPDHDELGFLYSVIAVDDTIGKPADGSGGAETGLCYFADQQIDRSPTGSGVAARAALAYAKGRLAKGQSWTYHSLVSNSIDSLGAFVGTVVDECGHQNDTPVVQIKVEGYAFYTGYHVFSVEKTDPFGDTGFIFEKLSP